MPPVDFALDMQILQLAEDGVGFTHPPAAVPVNAYWSKFALLASATGGSDGGHQAAASVIHKALCLQQLLEPPAPIGTLLHSISIMRSAGTLLTSPETSASITSYLSQLEALRQRLRNSQPPGSEPVEPPPPLLSLQQLRVAVWQQLPRARFLSHPYDAAALRELQPPFDAARHC